MLQNTLASAGLVLVGALSLPTSATAATTLSVNGGEAQTLTSLNISVNGTDTIITASTTSSGGQTPAPNDDGQNDDGQNDDGQNDDGQNDDGPAPGENTGSCATIPPGIESIDVYSTNKERVDLKDEIKSFRIVTNGSTTATGTIDTHYTTINPSARTTWISNCPGDSPQKAEAELGARCTYGTGYEVSTLSWGQAAGRYCVLQPNSTYYFNIKNATRDSIDVTTCRGSNCPAILERRLFNP